MRPVIALLLFLFSTSIFAQECGEIKLSASTEEIIELYGQSSCRLRMSLYLFGVSRSLKKEVYRNSYECEGHNVDLKLERFRTREITSMLVSDVEITGRSSLKMVEFKKDGTSLTDFISDFENKNQAVCTELNRLFPQEGELFFLCGSVKLKVAVTPYIKCLDSWKSL
jgi:hypothetical protein